VLIQPQARTSKCTLWDQNTAMPVRCSTATKMLLLKCAVVSLLTIFLVFSCLQRLGASLLVDQMACALTRLGFHFISQNVNHLLLAANRLPLMGRWNGIPTARKCAFPSSCRTEKKKLHGGLCSYSNSLCAASTFCACRKVTMWSRVCAT
jgi:hypothetical protein